MYVFIFMYEIIRKNECMYAKIARGHNYDLE